MTVNSQQIERKGEEVGPTGSGLHISVQFPLNMNAPYVILKTANMIFIYG